MSKWLRPRLSKTVTTYVEPSPVTTLGMHRIKQATVPGKCSCNDALLRVTNWNWTKEESIQDLCCGARSAAMK